MRMKDLVLLTIVVLFALVLAGCGDEDETSRSEELDATFEATAERPYTFDYPSGWVLGDGSEGEVALGIQDRVGVVLEPVHPWAGAGAFGREGTERAEVDGYEAYRMSIGGGEREALGLAYRIDADGTDVSFWFFAMNPADYDEDLFLAIVDTFRIEEALLPS